MNVGRREINNLRGVAQFVLFATSYIPLFILIAFKQISDNSSFLFWGGFSLDSIDLFFRNFGLASFAILISIVGYIGYKWTFKNLERISPNGENITIIDVDNKNSESIGYISTYIVPFLFQNFNSWFDTIALFFLMIIIYKIYINSNLILINPILSFKYSLFLVEYKQQNNKKRNGLIIIKDRYIEEGEIIKIYEIGFKLYYGTKKNS